MVKTIETLGKALIPPGITPQLAWRITVSGTLFAVTIVLALHIADANGWIGGGGFARADELADVKRLQLEEKLDEIHTVICMADPGEIEAYVVERARNLEREYLAVNGGDPYDVNCELLLKLRP